MIHHPPEHGSGLRARWRSMSKGEKIALAVGGIVGLLFLVSLLKKGKTPTVQDATSTAEGPVYDQPTDTGAGYVGGGNDYVPASPGDPAPVVSDPIPVAPISADPVPPVDPIQPPQPAPSYVPNAPTYITPPETPPVYSTPPAPPPVPVAYSTPSPLAAYTGIAPLLVGTTYPASTLAPHTEVAQPTAQPVTNEVGYRAPDAPAYNAVTAPAPLSDQLLVAATSTITHSGVGG